MTAENRSQIEELVAKITLCDRTKPYVYVSYSTRDALQVYSSVLHLQEEGVNLWIDVPKNFNIGEGYNSTIFKTLAHENCKGVLFYMSEESMMSAQTVKELAYTKAQPVLQNHAEGLPIITVELADIEHHDVGVWVEGYFYQTYGEDALSPVEYSRIEKYREKYNNRLDRCETKYCLAYHIYEHLMDGEIKRIEYESEDQAAIADIKAAVAKL